jgi:hypothetical protein
VFDDTAKRGFTSVQSVVSHELGSLGAGDPPPTLYSHRPQRWGDRFLRDARGKHSPPAPQERR